MPNPKIRDIDQQVAFLGNSNTAQNENPVPENQIEEAVGSMSWNDMEHVEDLWEYCARPSDPVPENQLEEAVGSMLWNDMEHVEDLGEYCARPIDPVPENQREEAVGSMSWNGMEHVEDLGEYCARPTDPYKKNEEYQKKFNTDTGFGRRGIQEKTGLRALESANIKYNGIDIEEEEFFLQCYKDYNWVRLVEMNLVRDCPQCQEELTHWKASRGGKCLLVRICEKCRFFELGTLSEGSLEQTRAIKFGHPLRPFIGFRDKDVPTKYPSISLNQCHCCGLIVLYDSYEDHLKHACCGEFQPSTCEFCPAEFNSLEELYSHCLEEHQFTITNKKIESMLRFKNGRQCRLYN